MKMFVKLFAFCTLYCIVLQHEASGSPVNQLLGLDDVVHDDKQCKDLRDDCSNIPAKGEELMKYCEVWKDDVAVQECPKTCGRCKAPSPPVGCQDEEDDCHWITDMHPNVDDLAEYCSGHRNDIAVKQCKKTCQLCNAPFPPADCKDERDDCSWITDNNPDADDLAKYCIEYRDDDAVKQCKKTCGLC